MRIELRCREHVGIRWQMLRASLLWLAALLVGCGSVSGTEGDDDGVSVPHDGCDPGAPATRTASCVVSFSVGEDAGWGADGFPEIIYGEPRGTGMKAGSLDVLSLGVGGEIVVGFGGNSIVDAPGPDLIVFENAFFITGTEVPYAELAEVSLSEDGESWHTFPCAAAEEPPEGCAGWHPVFANPDDSVSSFDPEVSGGDAFDLAELGLASARLVRIRDLADGKKIDPGKAGFDLDALAIVHALVE